MPARKNNIMDKYYANLNFAGAFTGQNNLKRTLKGKVTKKQFKNFLESNRTYTLFRPRRSKFKRLKTIPLGYLSDLQVDLADFSLLKEFNDQKRFCLVCCDSLSRMAFVSPLDNKQFSSIRAGMEKVLSEMRFQPISVFSDKGGEFESNLFKNYLKEKGIQKYTAENQSTKASQCERLIRSLKERLYKYFSEKNTLRWIEPLEKIVKGYNHTVHTVTKMRPIDCNEKNQQELWERLYNPEDKKAYKQRFNVGDFVRIPYKKETFEKGYLANWSDSIKKIVKCYKTSPLTYGLEDETNKERKVLRLEISRFSTVFKFVFIHVDHVCTLYLIFVTFGSLYTAFLTFLNPGGELPPGFSIKNLAIVL